LLNPLAWTHYALFLLLPASLVWRAATASNSGLSETERARLRRAVGIAIVTLSVPKETICLLVLPFPASPLAAPLLSLHALAALLLFTAAAVAARWTVRAAHA
jgi:hypothetical protein